MTQKKLPVKAVCPDCGNEYIKSVRSERCLSCANIRQKIKGKEWREANTDHLKEWRAANKDKTKIYNYKKYRMPKIPRVKQEPIKESFISHLEPKLKYAIENKTSYAEMQRADTLKMVGGVKL